MVCSNGVCSFENSHVAFLLKSNDLDINLHQLSFYLLVSNSSSEIEP